MVIFHFRKLIENNDNYIEVPLIFDPVKEVDFNTDFTCVAWNSLGHQVQATQVKPEGTCLYTFAICYCEVDILTFIVCMRYMGTSCVF